MAKTNRAIADEPWHAETEIELLERPGVCFIHLLTDECGCLLLAKGIIPEYLRRQAEYALAWNATQERGLAQRELDRVVRKAKTDASN